MIAVTGATGFLGHHLTHALSSKKMDFLCLTRSSSPRAYRLKPYPSTIREVDFQNKDSIAQQLEGCSTLIHVLGLINAKEDRLKQVNVEYTKNLLEAAKEKKVQKIIFISSVAAQMRHGLYGETKFQAEELVRSAGVPYLILRPAFIYGQGDDNNMGLMLRTLKRYPLIPLLGGGSFRIQPIYVEDIVSVVLQGLEKPAPNKEYNLAGPQQVSLKEILMTLAKHLKVKRLFVPIPLKPIQAILRVYILFFRNTKLPVKQILELDKHEAFDISKTREDFDFDPCVFQEGTQRMFEAPVCVE